MRDLQLVTKLLHITPDVKHPNTRQVLFSLLSILLGGQPRQSDLLLFGQFLAATLPTNSSPGEKSVELCESNGDKESEGEHILLRNRCLSLVHNMLFTGRNAVSLMICEEITRTLGFDWVLLFVQPHLHPTTVVWALRILVVMCSNQPLMTR